MYMDMLYGPFPYLILVLLLAAGNFGLPLPEELPLMAMGALSLQGLVNPYVAAALGWGIMVGGDCLMYWLGRKVGRGILARRPFRLIARKDRIEALELGFTNHGGKLVFLGRFLAGFRSAMGIMAGISRYSFPRFLLITAPAAAIISAASVFLGYIFADRLSRFIQDYHRVRALMAILGLTAVAAIFLFIFYKKKLR